MSSSSYTSYSSTSYSSSSSSGDGMTSTGHRSMQQTHTDPSGHTTVHRADQTLGGPAQVETRTYDSAGRELLGGGAGDNTSRRIEDVSDEQQAQRDREYEERMEEEYAKREGGA